MDSLDLAKSVLDLGSASLEDFRLSLDFFLAATLEPGFAASLSASVDAFKLSLDFFLAATLAPGFAASLSASVDAFKLSLDFFLAAALAPGFAVSLGVPVDALRLSVDFFLDAAFALGDSGDAFDPAATGLVGDTTIGATVMGDKTCTGAATMSTGGGGDTEAACGEGRLPAELTALGKATPTAGAVLAVGVVLIAEPSVLGTAAGAAVGDTGFISAASAVALAPPSFFDLAKHTPMVVVSDDSAGKWEGRCRARKGM